MAVSEMGLPGAGSRKLGGIFAVSFLLGEQPKPKKIRFKPQIRRKSFIDVIVIQVFLTIKLFEKLVNRSEFSLTGRKRLPTLRKLTWRLFCDYSDYPY